VRCGAKLEGTSEAKGKEKDEEGGVEPTSCP